MITTHKLYPILCAKNQRVATWLERFFNREPVWEDLTTVNLKSFSQYLHSNLSPNSVKTYLAELRSIINLYKEEVTIPCKNLKAAIKTQKVVKSTHCYLTVDDLNKLEELEGLTKSQEDVRDIFLLQAWTGCRLSDAIRLTRKNINGNILSYTSEKTQTFASIPVKPIVGYIIDRLPEIKIFTKPNYNRTLGIICEMAGLDEEINLTKGGKRITIKKHEGVSSHTARRSFATNLYEAGIEINKISYMMGHSATSMTERYICSNMELNDEVINFFK